LIIRLSEAAFVPGGSKPVFEFAVKKII